MNKMLITILSIISILIIIVAIYGRVQQKQVTAEILIEMPIKTVWESWSSFRNVEMYVPMIHKAYTISDIVGDVGHTRRCKISDDAFVDEEIVAWNPGKSFELSLRKKHGVQIDEMNILSEVEPHPEGTTASITIKYKMTGLMNWLHIHRVMQQQAIDHLLGLKYFIEKGYRVNNKSIKFMREAYSNFYSAH
ncbi:MAG: SRPBCC family protein [Cyclobacteriaceae bacterium]